jgi:hypothetical protein
VGVRERGPGLAALVDDHVTAGAARVRAHAHSPRLHGGLQLLAMVPLDGALGPARPETDLLKVVGIDLEQVRSAVRRTFGESALEELGRRRVHQAWQPWRRPTRRCMSILAGSMSVAPRVKRAFARARYHAERRQLVAIDPATLLLGMVEVKDALSNRILRDLGVDFERLRARLQVT